MKRIIGILLAGSLTLGAQTTVYLRSSAPTAVPVATLGANGAVTAPGHGLSAGNVVGIYGLCGSDGTLAGQSLINGIHTVCSSPAPTTNTFSACTLLGASIMATAGVNCDPVSGSPGASWVGKLTAYTLGTGPLGWFDGLNGQMLRKLALGTANGLATSGGVVVTGCPSACVVTITTTYNPSTFGTIPVSTSPTQYFSVQGTTSSALNTAGTSSAYAPWTIASVSSSGWVSAPVAIPGLSNGDYTTNNTCGPSANDSTSGSQNCVRVSQIAYTGNPFWNSIESTLAGITGISYRDYYGGGTQLPDGYDNLWNYWGQLAMCFLADPTNSTCAAGTSYAFTHLERGAGVNFTVNEAYSNGDTFDWAQGLTWIYAAWGAGWNQWASSANQEIFLQKIYNDVLDPNNTASKADANCTGTTCNKVTAAGTASGGSGTTITTGSCSGIVANEMVVAVVSGNNSYGLVNGCTGGTVSVPSWSNGSPSIGTTYQVLATITIASPVPGATTTVTGYGTAFTSDVAVGWGIMASNAWNTPQRSMSYISTVTSDSALTVINAQYTTATSTPQIAWYFKPWQSGDVGLFWQTEYWAGSTGSQPILYPPLGGSGTAAGGYNAYGSNNGSAIGAAQIAMDLACANDSAMCSAALSHHESYLFDYQLTTAMTYRGGFGWCGGNYDYYNCTKFPDLIATELALSIPTFPSLDLTGNWIQSSPLMNMFSALPDFQNAEPETGNGSHDVWPVRRGSENGTNEIESESHSGKLVVNQSFVWSPTSAPSLYYQNWLASTAHKNNFWTGASESSTDVTMSILYNDPRIVGPDYTAQPPQQLFQANSSAVCASTTGWTCPTTMRGDAFISRGSWTSTSAPFVYYGSRAYRGVDHDFAAAGSLYVYQVGDLLASEYGDIGCDPDGYSNDGCENQTDTTTSGMMLQIGGSSATVNQGGNGGLLYGSSPITAWSSANHGSWPTAYGDQSGQYAMATSNMAPAYTGAANIVYAQRVVADSKAPGVDHFLFQFESVALSTPNIIRTHFHFPQIPNGVVGNRTYTPGTTTISGTTPNLVVTEVESGVTDIYGNPAQNYGLLWKDVSPGTITVADDGVTWTGNSGFCAGNACTHRVTVAAGSSVTASSSLFEATACMKLMNGISDTTFSCTALTPDANWTGAQACGAVSCAVFLGARGGTTHAAITTFTPSFSGAAQWLFSGLTAGTYTVTVNGIPVSGSPFTVGANDNSIEFISTAGTMAVSSGASSSSTTILGHVAVGGNTAIH